MSEGASALQPLRVDKEVNEWNVFELMTKLASRGFVGQQKDRSAGPECDYVHNDPAAAKVWWVTRSTKRLSRWYLLCLLTADSHGQPVKHLQPTAYYTCLLQGLPYSSAAVRSRGVFAFLPEGAEGDHLDAKAHRSKSKRRRLSQALASCGEGEEEEAEQSDDSEGSEVREATPSRRGEPGAGSDAASAASSEPAASGVSSSSSSSSDDESDAEERAPGDAREGPRAASAGSAPCRERAEEHTHHWKGFKFTPVYKDVVHRGWEATCYNPHHAKQCRRTLTFRSPADAEVVVRRLRFWCLQSRTCANKQSHQTLPYMPAVLPEWDELEAADPSAGSSGGA